MYQEAPESGMGFATANKFPHIHKRVVAFSPLRISHQRTSGLTDWLFGMALIIANAKLS